MVFHHSNASECNHHASHHGLPRTTSDSTDNQLRAPITDVHGLVKVFAPEQIVRYSFAILRDIFRCFRHFLRARKSSRRVQVSDRSRNGNRLDGFRQSHCRFDIEYFSKSERYLTRSIGPEIGKFSPKLPKKNT